MGSISPHRSWLARQQVLPRSGYCMLSNIHIRVAFAHNAVRNPVTLEQRSIHICHSSLNININLVATQCTQVKATSSLTHGSPAPPERIHPTRVRPFPPQVNPRTRNPARAENAAAEDSKTPHCNIRLLAPKGACPLALPVSAPNKTPKSSAFRAALARRGTNPINNLDIQICQCAPATFSAVSMPGCRRILRKPMTSFGRPWVQVASQHVSTRASLATGP